MTISGRTCQDWSSQYPHKHEQTDKIMLRNSRNYCRNPDGEPGGPWCYTNDRNKRWEYCNIPSCRKILPLWIFVYWFFNNNWHKYSWNTKPCKKTTFTIKSFPYFSMCDDEVWKLFLWWLKYMCDIFSNIQCRLCHLFTSLYYNML